MEASIDSCRPLRTMKVTTHPVLELRPTHCWMVLISWRLLLALRMEGRGLHANFKEQHLDQEPDGLSVTCLQLFATFPICVTSSHYPKLSATSQSNYTKGQRRKSSC